MTNIVRIIVASVLAVLIVLADIFVISLSDKDKNAGQNGKYFSILACKSLKVLNIYTRHMHPLHRTKKKKAFQRAINFKTYDNNSLMQQKFDIKIQYKRTSSR